MCGFSFTCMNLGDPLYKKMAGHPSLISPTHQGRLQREAGRILTGPLVLLPRDAHIAVPPAEGMAGATRTPIQCRTNKERLAFFTVLALKRKEGEVEVVEVRLDSNKAGWCLGL